MAQEIVLVVHDRALREVLSDVLDSEGFTSVSADRNEEVGKVADKHDIRAVFADLEGLSRHRTVQEDMASLRASIARTPIVLCSARPYRTVAENKATGAEAVLPMPFGIDERLGVLTKVLDSQEPISGKNCELDEFGLM